jgi:hypothetical protein|tara:strand:- start:4711 stop:4947 length:237 start_codon:yes stop_codon:yes gene_type:complete
MQEIIKLIIGILVLISAFPIGSYLAKITKEELKQGKKWFKLIILVSLIGTIISLILKKDILFFSFLFVAIVTSRNLRA